MKRLLYILPCILLILASCASPDVTSDGGDEDEAARQVIGLSMGAEGAFADSFTQYIKSLAEMQGYELLAETCADASEQSADIEKLLSDGAEVMIVYPANTDGISYALDECDLKGVGVVNVMLPAGGVTSSLICPDYAAIGERAAALADEARRNLNLDSAEVCLLEEEADSFIMQLIQDGFLKESERLEHIKAIDSEYFSSASETLAPSGLDSLAKSDILFACNTALAEEAADLITTASPAVIAFSGEINVIRRVQSGDLYAALYIDPAELAQKAMQDAVALASDPEAEVASYTELSVGIADAESAGRILEKSAGYAVIVN